jgi:hypothetical protein
MPDLKKNFIDGTEFPMIVQNYVGQGFLNSVYPDTIAELTATRALNHEMLLNAGFITFRNSAGSVPSGIIESVNVTFNATTGVNETINFTNVFNDNRIASYFPMPNVRRVDIGDSKAQRLANAKLARNALKEFNAAARAAGKKDQDKQLNERNAARALGDASTAMTAFKVDDVNDDIFNGDVLVVNMANEAATPLALDDGVDTELPERPFGVA